MVADARGHETNRSGAAFQNQADGKEVRSFRGSFSGRERDCLFVRGGGRFVDAAPPLGTDFDHDGRAVAAFDPDGDGDLDLAVLSLQGLRLLENTSPARSWIRFRLRGTRGHPLALGATVLVRAGGRAQLERVRLTAGFHTQVTPEVHFGLGEAKGPVTAEVRWPSGEVQRIGPLEAERRYLVVQGAAPEPLEHHAWPPETRPRSGARYDLGVKVRALDGAEGPLGRAGAPTVVNFWAPWCEACTREVPALARLAKARPGVRVVGISAEVRDVDSVRAFATRHGLDYPLRLANDAVVATFFGEGGRMTLPATFVFDPEGQLRRGLVREVRLADLEGALAGLRATPTAHAFAELATTRAAAGELEEALEHLRTARRLDPTDPLVRWRLGEALLQAKRPDQAIPELQEATRLQPDDDVFIGSLAAAHRRAGRSKEGEQLLRRGLERRPDSAVLWRGLGDLLERSGRPVEAVTAWRESVRRRRFQPRVWFAIAGVLEVLGATGEAQQARTVYESLTGKRDFDGRE